MKKYNIKKAFTLLELMVIMSVMTVLLAALSPAFTGKSNPSSDVVWHYVPGDRNDNAYSNPLNSYLRSAFYIGVAPTLYDMVLMDNAKLTIRPSNRLNQSQIDLMYNKDESAASIFASPENLLFGGPYSNILVWETEGQYYPNSTASNARFNTAFGTNALNEIKKHKNNTAVGYNALKDNNTKTIYNVMLGTFEIPINNDEPKGDTFIGRFYPENGERNNLKYDDYNTIIGDYPSVKVESSTGKYNTLIGANAAPKLTGSYNVVVGSNAAPNLTTGKNNTILGYAKDDSGNYRLLSTGSNNTLIGVNSGLGLGSGASNKTCIGYGSCPKIEDYDSLNLLNDDVERVFIGGPPRHGDAVGDADFGGYAVLEVHNSSNKKAKRHVKGASGDISLAAKGDETVIVNGNLIVRGQTYLGGIATESSRPKKPSLTPPFGNDDDMPLYGMSYDWVSSGANNYKVFYAKDGSDILDNIQIREKSPFLKDSRAMSKIIGKDRAFCACSPDHKSYDWFTYPISYKFSYYIAKQYEISINSGKYYTDSLLVRSAENGYQDQSYVTKVIYKPDFVYYNTRSDAENDHNRQKIEWSDDEVGLRLYNMAHGPSSTYASCCPYLRGKESDSRLKNIGKSFDAGLDALKKLRIYNYTFKSDPNKTHNVGVIAQDLKRVFPNAVSKDKNGYYKIRWDEMFYAAINAVKGINARVENLAQRVAKDIERVQTLKHENAQLARQLEKLAQELTELENKK